MAVFIYTGQPTAGKSTKDIKAPNVSGGWTVYSGVTPNVTEISTSDTKEIEYFQKYSNSFSQQS